MSSATQTLLGLYQIGLARDKNFFNSLTFPTGIDHDLAVTNILHEAGDFEVLYPDLDFMTDACAMFSLKYERTFQKWVEVMNIEYDPLENYNRLEHWSDSTSESGVHSLSSSESTSASDSTSTSVHTSDSTSNSTTTDNDISAFNASTLQNDTSATVDAITAGQSTNDSKTQNMTLSRTDNKLHEDNERQRLYDHGGRVHGNIGVMTTQAMYKEEWELAKLNIYNEIYILFAREFLIPFSY